MSCSNRKSAVPAWKRKAVNNAVAAALAGFVAVPAFAAEMNAQAKRLGMTGSHFIKARYSASGSIGLAR